MISTGENGNKLDKIFDKIEKMFEAVSERQDSQRDRIKDIEANNATIDSLRNVQDEMRTHVEEQCKKQSDQTMQLVDTKLGSIRQGIMTDTEKLLRDHLNEWMEAKLKPMVNELIEAQEAKAKAERSALLRMWRERAALATAVVVLLWAIFNPFNSADNPRETSRIGSAIGTLDDIAN
jgi:membrane protein involved in colicin uptake